MSVDLLILGAGWTSTFLISLCEERGIRFAATSRSGRDATIPFVFDPDSDDQTVYETLPDAQTVLITFPIQKGGASQRLVEGYKSTRRNKMDKVGFIQLGATSIWDPTKTSEGPSNGPWCDRHSPYSHTARAVCEDELLALSPSTPAIVLNLAGLWGDQRLPRNWVGRVAPTKDALRSKGSLHLIHGIDVARAVLAVHGNLSRAQGQRWILTDGRTYDWWDLASGWGAPPRDAAISISDSKNVHSSTAISVQDSEDQRGPQPRWVGELMEEQGIRALPRSPELLGRALDSREFWTTFDLNPVKPLLGCC
ncbi:hypothetical protein P691DRAFT_711478 [Macrolepiota fuliginosa MF-IS2]|uniref:Uncharacterized protein n=1 Tax=Macrolepiota fuliginosa MF-IS2 TaxID=1400762 RepID=A0A9P5X558_9AGAR|nr:hypothetical protein P691DRAFT_711478 [Macrolepiota fuliginosa MF-IS2]